MPTHEKNEIKTDLKHDTMEFSAPSDGDDKLDLDDNRKEDDGISGEELDAFEDEDVEKLDEAFMAAELDSQADNTLLEEEEIEDYEDNDEPLQGETDGRI